MIPHEITDKDSHNKAPKQGNPLARRIGPHLGYPTVQYGQFSR